MTAGHRPAIDRRPEVTIVGAGPTGLTAALVLAGYGVHPIVLDAAAQPPTTSRAVLAHASTLELLRSWTSPMSSSGAGG